MSKAKEKLSESIKDAKELLAYFDRSTGGKRAAPPKESEV
jgi:hypothetical protein